MKVAIVSGYFNPLHGGHLDLIEAARAIGDKLIVIINNDQAQTLRKIREIYPDDELIFGNGGDRDPNKHALPENEMQTCTDCDIKVVFGVGSHEVEKRDSSSRINQASGHEVV